jgi:hypothetical protein
VEPGLFAFRKQVTREQVRALDDEDLGEIFARTQRYQGKGCLNAVDNVREVIAPYFRERNLADVSFLELDRALLQLERQTAQRRGRDAAATGPDPAVAGMQRKASLGMNAVLSVSLALARAVAHVRGLELWELLREEIMGIIERLANAHGIAIESSRFEDYVELCAGLRNWRAGVRFIRAPPARRLRHRSSRRLHLCLAQALGGPAGDRRRPGHAAGAPRRNA